jgi:hypothetical protein
MAEHQFAARTTGAVLAEEASALLGKHDIRSPATVPLARYRKPQQHTIAAVVTRERALLSQIKMSQGNANMDDHETRRKIIREWMALPKDKRETAEQAAAFAKKAVQQNEFHRSRRDPDQKFRRDPFETVMGWLLPRAGKSRAVLKGG